MQILVVLRFCHHGRWPGWGGGAGAWIDDTTDMSLRRVVEWTGDEANRIFLVPRRSTKLAQHTCATLHYSLFGYNYVFGTVHKLVVRRSTKLHRDSLETIVSVPVEKFGFGQWMIFHLFEEFRE